MRGTGRRRLQQWWQDDERDAAPAQDAAPPDAVPANATLAALTATAGVLDPPFEPEVTEYDLDLVLAEPDVAFAPTAATPDGTTIEVNGAVVASGATSRTLALTPGSRDVDIVVIAADGAAVTYRVHVHRGVDALASLTPSGGALLPAFDPASTSYALGLPVATTTLAWTPTLVTPGRASITVDGAGVASGSSSTAVPLGVGAESIFVIVTPQTRLARTYDVAAYRGIDALATLVASNGVLDPPFQPDVTEYDLDLVLAETAVALTPTAAVPAGTTITVDGVEVASGAASSTLPLTPGSHEIDIVVAASGGATETYRLHVHRGVDALASLAPSNGALEPVFDPAMTSYALGLPLATTTVAWTPTLLTPGRATITVDGAGVPSGTSSAAASLVTGDNPDAVVVTPLSRPARTYDLGVVRGADALASISLSYTGGSVTTLLAPAFDPATSTYDVSVGLWLQRVQVTVEPMYGGSSITVSGGPAWAGTPTAAIALNLGLTPIPIVVTAPGGVQRTYTLNVTRASSVLQQAFGKASNTGAGDAFAYRVALWGDTLAVGANSEDSVATGVGGNQTDNSAAQGGAVYVFTRTGSTWSQQAYLKASNTEANDQFGISVALSGDTLAVGAIGEDSAAGGVNGNQGSNTASDSGAVYVLTRTGTTWSQQAYLKASRSDSGDQFGGAVSLLGDTLAVGARLEDSQATGIDGIQVDNGAADSGAVYVFTRSGTSWSQQAYVKASDTRTADNFGTAVALSADTLAIGAPGEDSGTTGVGGDQDWGYSPNSGAVYVFRRSVSGTWSQQAFVKASNTSGTSGGDGFGTSVALWEATLAVGASLEDSAATGVGGDQTDNSALDSGAVYMFSRSGISWTQRAYLKASNTGAADAFGTSLSLWGDTLAVGASAEDSSATGIGGASNESAAGSGAAYMFTRSGITWSPHAYLKASNTGASDAFGTSVALWGDTLAVGGNLEDSAAIGVGGDQTSNSASDSGAVYIFR